jgi:radical SAM superfamily enzyme YgiQ (UPF0313 family)
MKLTLVHAPFGHRAFSENLRVVDEEFIRAPPLVLAYVAAIAEAAGHQVDLVDAHVTGMAPAEAAARVRAHGAEAIGFRTDVYNFRQTLAWIDDLKRATGLPTIVGGIGMSEYPVEAMSHPSIDYGITGEAIAALPALLDALGGRGAPADVPGLLWRDGDRLVRNPPAAAPADFDDYPFPARHLLPNERYHSFVSKRRNFTIMVTSTGCPFHCAFCEIAPLHYRVRSPGKVAAEVDECCRRYGVREIDFFDATFFIDKPRSLEICDRIARLGHDLQWTCRSRVDLVDDEILRVAARAGCRQVNFGIEAASPEILKNVNKGIDQSQVRDAIAACRRHGIRTLGFFMIGNPGETAATVEETIRYMRTLDLDFVQVCRTIPKPGSALNRRIVAETGRDLWAEYVRGTYPEQRLPTPWTTLTQEEVERYLKKAYFGFFFRPGLVARTALGVRSVDELARYVRVGLRMLMGNRSDIG